MNAGRSVYLVELQARKVTVSFLSRRWSILFSFSRLCALYVIYSRATRHQRARVTTLYMNMYKISLPLAHQQRYWSRWVVGRARTTTTIIMYIIPSDPLYIYIAVYTSSPEKREKKNTSPYLTTYIYSHVHYSPFPFFFVLFIFFFVVVMPIEGYIVEVQSDTFCTDGLLIYLV